jgi:hypothetical protein
MDGYEVRNGIAYPTDPTHPHHPTARHSRIAQYQRDGHGLTLTAQGWAADHLEGDERAQVEAVFNATDWAKANHPCASSDTSNAPGTFGHAETCPDCGNERWITPGGRVMPHTVKLDVDR